MTVYYRPLVQVGATRPAHALPIAGGWCWFEHALQLHRGGGSKLIPAAEVPADILDAITRPRGPIAGLTMDRPRLMGIVNVTPDSFSDGGKFDQADRAISHGLNMVKTGADIIDIGGESTRPGAVPVADDQEIARTAPVIRGIRGCCAVPISIDTRKSGVAAAALGAGATMVNDVSALRYDSELSEIISENNVPVCLMHARGDPETMQDNPEYDDVLMDVFDHLSSRVANAVSGGISREKIILDPGIGFGKTVAHNLALIRNIALFHSLGCPILLGASRKGFIGEIANQPDASARLPGSIAVTLVGISQGVQISRVHDIAETRQALDLWMGVTDTGQAR